MSVHIGVHFLRSSERLLFLYTLICFIYFALA